jgi:hypothetical protein
MDAWSLEHTPSEERDTSEAGKRLGDDQGAHTLQTSQSHGISAVRQDTAVREDTPAASVALMGFRGTPVEQHAGSELVSTPTGGTLGMEVRANPRQRPSLVGLPHGQRCDRRAISQGATRSLETWPLLHKKARFCKTPLTA